MKKPTPHFRALLERAVGAPLPEEITIDVARSARSPSELVTCYGLTKARAERLHVVCEAARVMNAASTQHGTPIRGGGDVYRLLSPRLRTEQKEHLVVLLLDGRHRLLEEITVSVGSLTSTVVHPREVFKPAIREGAAAIIVAHNHPSGDPTPSREDLMVTARLLEVGSMVGIELIDHVIIGDPGFVSLRERGHITGPTVPGKEVTGH